MSDDAINQAKLPRTLRALRFPTKPMSLLVVLWSVIFGSIFVLEARFVGLETTQVRIGETPVTLYRAADVIQAPPVIVAHGFAGSRQMMDQISVTLARQGFLVASIDLPGHGRNLSKLSPDVSNIDGTTADLVRIVEQVAESIVARPDSSGPISFVGHSMASDIVVRAAQAVDNVGGVAAISMYSTAVNETAPQSLLILNGAFESRLRAAGLDVVRQVASGAQENETVAVDAVTRRTTFAPFVGHVGVLYAQHSLNEIARWLRDATGAGQAARLDRSGWIAGVLLAALVLVMRPMLHLVPVKPREKAQKVPKQTFVACLILPIPVAALLAWLPILGVNGVAAFGTLTALLGAIGIIRLALLWRGGLRPERPDAFGTFIYLCAAGIFAFALDRYGAAFALFGDRWLLAAVLFLGALPCMLSDTLLVDQASFIRRLLVRFSTLLALACAFAVSPLQLGLTFTVLPVLVLFFLVYGTMARWIADRRGPAATGLGKAVVLAWAIAASTPLFAVAPL